jgi:ubiquinone/menaquinone biosynthesis C-methylase UbiE
VGFYSQVIFPRICDLFLDHPDLAEHRQGLLSKVGGEVLEIGFGTGLNLPHYPEHIRKITIIDPNVGMHRLARRRVAQARVEVDQRVHRGERLPFADCTFDCVVSTWTLCSIAEVDRALAEVYRVLKPQGRFLFLERGLSPEPAVQRWQRRLNRLEMWLADGCRLDRDIKTLVVAQPFRPIEIDEFYLKKMPRTHGYMYRGIATK